MFLTYTLLQTTWPRRLTGGISQSACVCSGTTVSATYFIFPSCDISRQLIAVFVITLWQPSDCEHPPVTDHVSREIIKVSVTPTPTSSREKQTLSHEKRDVELIPSPTLRYIFPLFSPIRIRKFECINNLTSYSANLNLGTGSSCIIGVLSRAARGPRAPSFPPLL